MPPSSPTVKYEVRNRIAWVTLNRPEAMNALTVGAVSEDLSANRALREIGGVMRLEADGEQIPQITSALGLGPLKSIKPDVLRSGGAHEVRALPAAEDTRLSVIETAERTGLVTAPVTRQQP